MKSADIGTGRMFELEMLEPRILLSSAPAELLAATGVTTLMLPQHDEVGGIHHGADQKPSASAFAQSAPEQVDGIFSGMVSEDLPAADAKNDTSSSPATRSANPATSNS